MRIYEDVGPGAWGRQNKDSTVLVSILGVPLFWETTACGVMI